MTDDQKRKELEGMGPRVEMAIPEFAAGAMENWGVVTYREVDLLIDQGSASSQQKQRVASVVTHELAHQWFGNLVTMQWWDNLWLNEGLPALPPSLLVPALHVGCEIACGANLLFLSNHRVV